MGDVDVLSIGVVEPPLWTKNFLGVVQPPLRYFFLISEFQ